MASRPRFVRLIFEDEGGCLVAFNASREFQVAGLQLAPRQPKGTVEVLGELREPDEEKQHLSAGLEMRRSIFLLTLQFVPASSLAFLMSSASRLMVIARSVSCAMSRLTRNGGLVNMPPFAHGPRPDRLVSHVVQCQRGRTTGRPAGRQTRSPSNHPSHAPHLTPFLAGFHPATVGNLLEKGMTEVFWAALKSL